MKKHHFFLLLFCILSTFVYAQEKTDASSLYASGHALMMSGNFDLAELKLDSALALKPQDLDILRDVAYNSYMRRDFSHAIEIGKQMVAMSNADEQSYQMLGLAYRSIAEYQECEKTYLEGLKRFPKSGVLFNEMGELLLHLKRPSEAIVQWEKGIRFAPNLSGNYYNAVKYYAQKNDPFWEIIYGETFVNLESYTARTAEIKEILYDAYQKLYKFSWDGYLNNSSPFVRTCFSHLLEGKNLLDNAPLTPEVLIALRCRFILSWYSSSDAAKFPFRLFDRERFLLQEGLFVAYSQWIFGPTANLSDYQQWIANNSEDVVSFKNYQQRTVFKIPSEQYYNK